MGFFAFLIVLAIISVAVVVSLMMSGQKDESSAPVVKRVGHGLGAPLFSDEYHKRFAMVFSAGDYVWVLTPYGPQRMEVTVAKNGEAHLINGEFEAIAVLDSTYFSATVAEGLGRSQGVWRLQVIHARTSTPHHRNDPVYEAANRQWLRDEFEEDSFGDLFDLMIFYEFMFNGFDQPLDYYETQEVPVFDDPEPVPEPLPEEVVPEEEPIEPEVVEEPDVDDTQDMPVVPSEVTEETFEEGVGDETPEPTQEPMPEATPEDLEAIKAEPEPPAPEPEPPTPEPDPPAPEPEPPAPEPEPERSWGGGSSYDSGDSYDSGGGGDDW